MMFTIAACGVVLLLIYIFIRNKQNGPEIPGPKGWPFIGVATQIDPKGLHHSLSEWSEKYGDVFKCTIFGETFVVLNSFETIYEALVKKGDDFAGRGYNYRVDVIMSLPEIVFTDICPRWKALKKLLMQKFKTYGSNIQVLQELTNEIYREDLSQKLVKAAETGEAFNAKPIFHMTITKIIGSMIFGRNSQALSSKWLKFEEMANSLLPFSVKGAILDAFPWTRFLPGMRSLYSALLDCRKIHQNALKADLKLSREQFNHEDIKSFADELLKHQMDFGTGPVNGGITDDEIYALTSDMLMAGTETTTLTMQGLIACLVNMPKLQTKIAKQIYEAIGERSPTTEDRPQLPLVEAMIFEILRYQSLLPTLVPHKTMTDVKMQGIVIPKGSQVLINNWKMCHDTEFWGDPYEFRPERFMQDDKILPVDHPYRKRLFSFGAGRRACTGENIAKTRLFLLLSEILRDFELLPESNEKRPQHDCRKYDVGYEIYPHPYKIRVKLREH